MQVRILFADDDADTRAIVADHLSAQGFAVETVADGVEAIDRLSENAYDLVLLDVRMPRKDGLEVLRFLKHLDLRPRVVMLTGVDELATALEAVKLGASDYLTKPFSFEALIRSIRRVLAS